MAQELPLLPEPTIVAPQGGRVDPYLTPRAPQPARAAAPDLAGTLARIGRSVARIRADELDQRDQVARERAEQAGLSPELYQALSKSLAGVQPGSTAEARSVDKVLREFGIPAAADQIVALRSLGADAAVKALGQVAAQVEAGTYDSIESGGVQAVERALAGARSGMLEQIPPSTTARISAERTFSVRSREILLASSARQAQARHSDAFGRLSGELAGGSADHSRRGLTSIPSSEPAALQEILAEGAETVAYAASLGHDPEAVAMAGLRSSIDLEDDPAGKSRIYHAFLTGFVLPSGPVMRPNGTLAVSAAMQAQLAQIEDEIEDSADREITLSERREVAVRTRLTRDLSDVAIAAATTAAREGADPARAADIALADYLRTERGADAASRLNPEAIRAATEVARGDAVGALVQIDDAMVAGYKRSVENALRSGDVAGASAIADSAPGSIAPTLRRMVDGTTPELLDAMEDGKALRRELEAAVAGAAEDGDQEATAAAQRALEAIGAAETAVLASGAADPAEAKARLAQTLGPIRQEVSRLAAARAASQAATVKVGAEVGALLLVDPRAARVHLAGAQGVLPAARVQMEKDIAYAEIGRANALSQVRAQVEGEAGDLVRAIGPGAGIEEGALERAVVTAQRRARDGMTALAEELRAAQIPVDQVIRALNDRSSEVVQEAVRAVVPGDGPIELTAEELEKTAATRAERALALALAGSPDSPRILSEEIAADFARAAGAGPGTGEVPPHVDRLAMVMRGAIAGKNGPVPVSTEVARFWLQAGTDEERAAGVRAMLTTGAATLQDLERGTVRATARFGSADELASVLRALAGPSDLDREAVDALAVQILALAEEGGAVAGDLGPFKIAATARPGFLGMGRSAELVLELPVGDLPGGITALGVGPEANIGAQAQALGIEVPQWILDELPRTNATVRPETRDLIARIAARRMSRSMGPKLAEPLGLKAGATPEQVEAALLRAVELGNTYR